MATRLSGRGFIVRMEDLDPERSHATFAESQLRDLAALGLGFDAEVMFQSERHARYAAVIDELCGRGLVYPCFCSRREIAAAVSAPHESVPQDLGAHTGVLDLVVERPYPGTCRSIAETVARRRVEAGESHALRLRAQQVVVQVNDAFVGPIRAVVDDLVLRRSDGVAAYNLAVVVDDASQRVSQVVRGDDLLASTPRQVHLQRLLGYPTPEYWHVPMVMGDDGHRLAKRTGGVTLDGLAELAITPMMVLRALAISLGFPGADQAVVAGDLVESALATGFGVDQIRREPVSVEELADLLASPPPPKL
jgi:glutamyl-tRNA synthetase